MATGFNVRVGDADRDAVAAQLREHYADGRLTLEELNERLDQAFAAKTKADLNTVMRDLPQAARPTAGMPYGGSAWQGPAWPGPMATMPGQACRLRACRLLACRTGARGGRVRPGQARWPRGQARTMATDGAAARGTSGRAGQVMPSPH